MIARRTLKWWLLGLVTAGLVAGYLGHMIFSSRSMPPIHDATTNLDDIPQFQRLPLRADNLAKVPDGGRAELKSLPADERWKALHRQAYGDLKTLRLPQSPQAILQRAEQLARDRGWSIAAVDPASGTLEATATTRLLRFKDDVVVRVRADPAVAGGSIVDMRSVSRIGVSDLSTNARRIRQFLSDLEETAR